MATLYAAKLTAPYAAMVHDFMVTKDYVLFPIMPLTSSMTGPLLVALCMHGSLRKAHT